MHNKQAYAPLEVCPFARELLERRLRSRRLLERRLRSRRLLEQRLRSRRLLEQRLRSRTFLELQEGFSEHLLARTLCL
jgi:hypothetical protein